MVATPRRHGLWLVLGLSAGLLALGGGCADSSSSKSLSAGIKGHKSKQQNQQSGQQQQDAGGSPDDVVVTNSFDVMTYSLSNNPLTSFKVRSQLAAGYAKTLGNRAQKAGDEQALQLQGIVTAKALAGANFAEILAATKRYMLVQMKRDVSSELPGQVRLQLAVAAMAKESYTMAQYQITQLLASKPAPIRAAAHNLNGLLFLKEGNFPDAVLSWQRALKVMPGYPPARLNLGFLAAKFGDFATAKKHLDSFQNDWFAATGLAVAERIAGNENRVLSLCTRILEQKPDYKPALLTCALNHYQGKNNQGAAKDLLKRLVKSNFGPKLIDELAYRVLGKIESSQQKAAIAGSKSAAGAIKKANMGKK